MIREKSRLVEKQPQEPTRWPTPERDLILRQVLPWPAADAQKAWDRGDVALAGSPAGNVSERSAPRTVRIEIVLGPSQIPQLAELLRHIFVARPGPPDPPAAEQSDSLPATQLFALTPREAEVLEQMMEGRSNRQIALDLGIATATVKCHVSNVLSKMGAESRTEAAVIALQQRAPGRGRQMKERS